MRRLWAVLGIGLVAGVGLFIVGAYVMPHIALAMMFGWIGL